ncbi:hypothetical protein KFE18_11085 [Clostridiaceae bacterium Marseille-Q4143]|nr:hypothetical protein KFE18_11085 [Clostridiaceae bacterium Marseille-Q4143]
MQEVGFEKLRYAVIVQTIQDYITALRYLRLPPYKQTAEGRQEAKTVRQDCERFFLSDWYMVFTNIEGDRLMEAVRRIAYSGKMAAPEIP